MSTIRRITLCTLALLTAAGAGADVLVMPNGDRIHGKKLEESNGRLRFSSDNFGILDQPSGVGRIDSEEAKPTKAEEEKPPTPPIYREGWGNNAIMQASMIFEDQRVPADEPVTWLDHWNHRVTGGVIHQTGVVDVTSYIAYYEGLWRGHENEFRAILDYMYATQRNEDGSRVTVGDRLKLEARQRHDVSKDVFTETLARYRRDDGQGIARRVTFAEGVGYRYLTTERIHAAVVMGLALRSDRYLRVTENDTRFRPFYYGGEEFEWRINDRVVIRHDLSVAERFGGFEAFSIDTGVEMEIALSRRLAMSFRYALGYDVDRQLEVDRFQEMYSTGIVFRF